MKEIVELIRKMPDWLYGEPHHFGRCPECKAEPLHVGLATRPGSYKLVNFMTCPTCKLVWCVGYGLISWPLEEPPPSTAEEAGIADYRPVDGSELCGPVGLLSFAWRPIEWLHRQARKAESRRYPLPF